MFLNLKNKEGVFGLAVVFVGKESLLLAPRLVDTEEVPGTSWSVSSGLRLSPPGTGNDLNRFVYQSVLRRANDAMRILRAAFSRFNLPLIADLELGGLSANHMRVNILGIIGLG